MTDLEQLAKEIIKSNTDLYQKDDDLSRIKDQIRETKNTTNTFKDNESFRNMLIL